MITILELTTCHLEQAAPLFASFRSTLRRFKNRMVEPDLEEGREEFAYFLEEKFPVYGAFVEHNLVGYIVCKVEGSLVWVEQIFVSELARKQGIATALFQRAERLSQFLGGETLFHYVHPNNHGMIAFLRKQGYTVLNLIEVRKPFEGEELTRTIQVGDETFDY
ncbi:GNAT family N-acetyltransferase [Streptococcus hillyeri]|uniref:GNAT family N-acetyltransferase n=1 Tax=Streptococcus hillyeri TaxID=2282420 RepID=A0A3L9DM43_9STRE|nr:GNAT family N-acetyltransferase [Streptococcus hillyeri]RLY01258.1 GNAT family N-acetyltransferase [Streptococcus hillyeri]